MLALRGVLARPLTAEAPSSALPLSHITHSLYPRLGHLRQKWQKLKEAACRGCRVSSNFSPPFVRHQCHVKALLVSSESVCQNLRGFWPAASPVRVMVALVLSGAGCALRVEGVGASDSIRWLDCGGRKVSGCSACLPLPCAPSLWGPARFPCTFLGSPQRQSGQGAAPSPRTSQRATNSVQSML